MHNEYGKFNGSGGWAALDFIFVAAEPMQGLQGLQGLLCVLGCTRGM